MKPTANDLLKQAKASQHKEAYQIITKTANYRAGIGVRLPPAPAQNPYFFIEIIVNLCPACSKVDLGFLEKALASLKALQENGYSLTCQDGNCVSCEKAVTKQTLQTELSTAEAILFFKL